MPGDIRQTITFNPLTGKTVQQEEEAMYAAKQAAKYPMMPKFNMSVAPKHHYSQVKD